MLSSLNLTFIYFYILIIHLEISFISSLTDIFTNISHF